MSNLLEKASILLTPTAYDDGKILSVKPSIVLGEELVVNGNFSTDTNWIYTTGVNQSWTISDGTANSNGNQSGLAYFNQSGAMVSGKTYKATFTVVSRSSGGVLIAVGGTSGTTRTEEGIYTEYLTATSNQLWIRADSNFVGSIDNVSVKEAIDADFQFTRNSSATRTNSQGLIEDMQILSGNLVSNGDFSQESSELVTNGDFATDADWSKGTGITVSGGSANFTGNANSFLTQSGVVSSNKTYKATFTVSNYISGAIDINLGGSTRQGNVNANGTYTFYIKVPSGNILYFQEDFTNGFIGSIDNVSVKEVGQDWTLTGTATITNNQANINSPSGQNAEIYQSSILTIGKKYKLDCTLNKTSGDTQFVNGGTFILNNGSNIIEFTATDTRVYFKRGAGSVISSITNISVQEITDDTNLPRIDYSPYSGAGSCGHWLFEPQSTNLINQSESFLAGWSKINGVVVSATKVTSPDGTLNASQLIYDGTNNGRIERAISGLTQGADYTVSVYARVSSGTQVVRFGSFNDFEYTLTTEWQRLTKTQPENDTVAFPRLRCDDAATIEIYAFQLEQQSFATSYIPTSGSTVTRNQEAAFGAGNSDLINSTEGVLYAEIAKFQDNNDNFILLSLNNSSDNSDNNTVTIGFDSDDDFFIRVEANSVPAFYSNDQTSSKNVFYKVALSYKSGDSKIYINGNSITPNTGSLTNAFSFGSTLDNLSFDFNGNGVLPFYGKTKCVAVFKEALTDDELECLTTDETSFSSFNALALANNYTII